MADKKQQTIIIKKITAAAHGHHGGAWKVAFADFMTAMMAFFLVMWLMGSDEETKAAIAHYFNHPDTPYKSGRDPDSNAVHPMGERNGQGDNLLSGMDGMNPDDLAPNPVRADAYLEKFKQMAELLQEVLGGEVFDVEVEIEFLKFSLPESMLFVPQTSQLRTDAKVRLDKIGRILQGYKGFLTIEDHTDELNLDHFKMSSFYEASIVKSVAVMNYLVKKNWMAEDRIHPVGATITKQGPKEAEAEPDGPRKKPHVEFTLKLSKKY